MPLQNLFDLPELPLPEELLTVLVQSGDVRIERIVSSGHTTDWYDQEENEFVALVQGEAKLAWADGSETVLVGGETLFIPKHKRHRVSYTGTRPPCVWLCVFWA